MSTKKVIVSDLHLADGVSILDCFGARQQMAFEGLLQAFSAAQDEVELIINGDCFDFLVTLPYSTSTTIDEQAALHKLERIIAAHGPFFTALHTFSKQPGHSITFTTGNHDIELCFAGVRARLLKAISGESRAAPIAFCADRFYRPLSNLHIEHGNNFDFWNHAVEGLWDEQGRALDRAPREILLSPGTRYFQQAAYEASLRYAYFDHFEPSLNSIRQIAFLCLLDPELVADTARRAMRMLSYPRVALEGLSSDEARDPARLFQAALLDFVAFSADMRAQKRDWPTTSEEEQISQAELSEFLAMQQALALPPTEAVAAMLDLPPYQMGEDVARGMHGVLEREPALRYALAGHTHMRRNDSLRDGAQVYLNTGSWTTRLTAPAPAEVTPALVAWLHKPDWQQVPLRDVTELTFALVTAQDDEATDAHLYTWEGGTDGTYRRLT